MNKHSAWLREEAAASQECGNQFIGTPHGNTLLGKSVSLRETADAFDALLAACITAREKLEMIKRGGVTWYLDVELQQLQAAIRLAEGEQP